MSIKTNYTSISMKVNNIPNIQPNGQWNGTTIPIGFLGRGMYFCNFNVGLQSAGGATIQSMTVAVSSVFEWNDVNSNIIISSPNTGNRAVSATQPLLYSMCNVCIIDTDNTPIFLMITCNVNIGTWGTIVANNPLVNIITFTKIGNV
jgi:hypothetical protein